MTARDWLEQAVLSGKRPAEIYRDSIDANVPLSIHQVAFACRMTSAEVRNILNEEKLPIPAPLPITSFTDCEYSKCILKTSESLYLTYNRCEASLARAAEAIVNGTPASDEAYTDLWNLMSAIGELALPSGIWKGGDVRLLMPLICSQLPLLLQLIGFTDNAYKVMKKLPDSMMQRSWRTYRVITVLLEKNIRPIGMRVCLPVEFHSYPWTKKLVQQQDSVISALLSRGCFTHDIIAGHYNIDVDTSISPPPTNRTLIDQPIEQTGIDMDDPVESYVKDLDEVPIPQPRLTKPSRWSKKQDVQLLKTMLALDKNAWDWSTISTTIGTRTAEDVQTRYYALCKSASDDQSETRHRRGKTDASQDKMIRILINRLQKLA